MLSSISGGGLGEAKPTELPDSLSRLVEEAFQLKLLPADRLVRMGGRRGAGPRPAWGVHRGKQQQPQQQRGRV